MASPETRTCGACNLCCKVSAIKELQKPAGQWCPHAKTGQGCAIHGRHPAECQTFRCGWLRIETLGEEWKPIHSKFVIRLDEGERRLIVSNDPAHPEAWKKPPFYQTIKGWARDWTVVACVGHRSTIVFPEEDLEVGEIYLGDVVKRGYRGGPLLRAPWVRVEPVGGAAPREYKGRYGKA
jgi:hypothetical protein